MNPLHRRLRELSIRQQLVLSMVLLLTLLMSLFVTYQVHRQGEFLERNSLIHAGGLANTLAVSSTSWAPSGASGCAAFQAPARCSR